MSTSYYYKSLCNYPFASYDFKDKHRAIRNHVNYMLARTQSMFEYEGLPESIPARMLELYLQINGFVGIVKINGDLYAVYGGLGGEPNAYYMPTVLTVANPALQYSANLRIDEDCIVFPSDSLYMGLMPMFSRYATALTENELSMNIAAINSRIINLVSAGDDRTKVSAEKYLKDIEAGNLGIIAEDSFLEMTGLHSNPYGNASTTQALKNLIEHEQYLKANWYNDLGLNANYNMKREALNSSENALNEDSLLPLVDDMLRCRKQGLEKVNAMYGTNISVRLASSWADNQTEIDLRLDDLKEGEERENAERRISELENGDGDI